MKKVNSIVIRVAGTNCDLETCYALKLAGSDSVSLIHINQLIRKEIKLSRYHILAVPGGFSYGDDVAAGKIFSTQLRYKLWKEIKDFDLAGKLIIGICNGFQVLVKLGLLPGIQSAVSSLKFKSTSPPIRQPVTLTYNNSGKFECRWVHLKKMQDARQNLWTENLPETIQLPVAHAEGKFVANNKKLLDELEQNGQVAFKYVDQTGIENAGYPYNPNGSERNIAGITNKQGNVLGLMPHPERYVILYQHPTWTRKLPRCPDVTPGIRGKSAYRSIQAGDGLQIFRNAVNYARKNLR